MERAGNRKPADNLEPADSRPAAKRGDSRPASYYYQILEERPSELEPIRDILARVFTDTRPCPFCTSGLPTFMPPGLSFRRCVRCLEAICLSVQAELEDADEDDGEVIDIALCLLENFGPEDVRVICSEPAKT